MATLPATSSPFCYDLLSYLRKNPAKARIIQSTLDNVDALYRQVAAGKAKRGEIDQELGKLVPLCGFNLGLLVPHYFPRYPADRPLSFLARPFMFSMTSLANGSVVTLQAGRQVGKCVTGDTVLETNLGPMRIQDMFDQGMPL